MSDEPVNESPEEEYELSDEELMLEDLKNRATTLGIKFHPSIGADKLSEKIKLALESHGTHEAVAEGGASISKAAVLTAKQEATKLIHVRISCMDPMKKEFQGDYFTTGNSVIGTIKRFVPFGVEWHVPQIMLNMMREKEYQMHTTKKNPNGIDTHSSRMAKTYAIEILEPMSPEEIAKLAQRQAMAAGATTV